MPEAKSQSTLFCATNASCPVANSIVHFDPKIAPHQHNPTSCTNTCCTAITARAWVLRCAGSVGGSPHARAASTTAQSRRRTSHIDVPLDVALKRTVPRDSSGSRIARPLPDHTRTSRLRTSLTKKVCICVCGLCLCLSVLVSVCLLLVPLGVFMCYPCHCMSSVVVVVCAACVLLACNSTATGAKC